jgi:putative peptide zinc metalloprotease protein
MATDRPTFHEAWYRVADLRPRLLSEVRIRRQYFRGQLWYVLENPANSEYARIAENAYRFIASLDGRRTVAQVWQLCNEHLGDGAPTQGEAIQLLGQLHAMNLLYVDLPPDAEGLFNRYRQRVQREVLGYLTNLLFIRIPLIDPDAFLDRWLGVLGSVFSWTGFCLWTVLLGMGLYFVIVNYSELLAQSADVLAPSNLFLLYVSLAIVKVCHEFSHAFACKRFGRLNRSAGEVHNMGVMFLVLFPLPYVDASSAWAFAGKWHRAIVGMAGVMAELAIASVAAIVWAHTSTGTVHIIAYNIIFVASVSTLLFNGNPLLRFDAYYVLSDLTEIPNLAQRSKNYLYYLVKQYIWGLRKTESPAYGLGEILWFLLYGTASSLYRIYISVRILLFLNRRLPEELFILVPLLAIAAIIGWLLIPLARFIRYLAIGPELARNRRRAVASTVGGLCAAVVLTGLVPAPDHYRIEGIVEPNELALIYAESDGFVTDFLPSESTASPDGPPLVQAVNPELEAQKASLLAERRGLEARYRLAETQETSAAQIIAEQTDALDETLARVQSQLDMLNLKPPFKGIWVAPQIEYTRGTYLKRGERIGFVGSLDDLILRVTAGQDVAAMIFEQASKTVEIRVKGRPDRTLTGRIEKILPAGNEELPSEALGYAAGGDMPTRSRAPQDRTAAERFFEIRIKPAASDASNLVTGQRVVSRLTMTSKPLLVQWYQSARRLFQRRFHI